MITQPEIVFETTASGSRTWNLANITAVNGHGSARYELDNEQLGYTTATFTRTHDGSARKLRVQTNYISLRLIDLSAADFVINNSLDLTLFKTIEWFKIYSTGTMESIKLGSTVALNTVLLANNSKVKTYDFSLCTNMGGDIRLYSNALLETITMPTSNSSTTNITNFYFYNNPKLTSIDLSQMTKLGGIIRGYTNSLMTTCIMPTTISSGNISSLEIYDCWALTSLDLSAFTKMGNVINLYQNYALTTLTLPSALVSSTAITVFQAQLNTSLTSLDMSALVSLGGNIRVYGNTVMTTLTLPVQGTLSSALTYLYLYSNPALTSLDISGIYKYNDCYLRVHSNTNMNTFTWFTPANLIGTGIADFQFYSNPVWNDTIPIGTVTQFRPNTVDLKSNSSWSRTNQYNTVKNIYNNRANYNATTAKTLNISGYGYSPLQAPTGYVQGANGTDPVDGTILTPTNDTERLQAIREMLYVLSLQKTNANPSLSSYGWTITI